MQIQFARGQKQHARVAKKIPSTAMLVTVVTAYALLLVAGTAHMSSAERAIALLPWKSAGTPVTQLQVRFGERVCEIDEVFVGDGMVRAGSRCVLQRRVTIHEGKDG
ncbi:hypothetical protein [Trinickia symbiotica]|uniref:hypothetical protein n=1 Tax=Trinickia symbiotica TaxID=863227 RepID=UPI00039F8706|nr:hypothetical protein [Trinickia symbiotica]